MKHLAQSFYAWYRVTLRHTKYRWLIVAATAVYLISPIDIAPDFIPIIGWLDDGVIVTLLVAELSQLALEFLKGHTAKGKRSSSTAEPLVVDAVE
jgi:uncharacterized membrane protein YkvA (DUF1232 family)